MSQPGLWHVELGRMSVLCHTGLFLQALYRVFARLGKDYSCHGMAHDELVGEILIAIEIVDVALVR